MKNLKYLALALPFILSTPSVYAKEMAAPEAKPASVITAPVVQMDVQSAVKGAFTQWREALSSGSAEKVVNLYADNAVLLATLAEKPITNQPARMDYFKGLVAKPKMAVKVDEELVRVLDENSAVISGVYTFSFEDSGKEVKIPARYTFVYEKMGDKWMIVEHHSSKTPSTN